MLAQSNPIPNIAALESLRGWMAWLVVLAHTSGLVGIGGSNDTLGLPGPIVFLLQSSDAAVRVFIILSGFAITNLVLSKREAYSKYITRRAFRIFPIYFFCLFAAITVDGLYETAYVTNPFTDGTAQADRLAEQSQNFWAHLALHLTLLHGLVPHTLLPFAETTFLAPAWTISLEWQFYVVAPLIIWALLRVSRGGQVFWVTLGVLLTVKLVQKAIGADWAHESFLPLAFEYFLIGILCRIALGSEEGSNSVELFLAIVTTFLLIGLREAAIWSLFFLIALHELNRLPISSTTFARFAWLIAYNPLSRAAGMWSYSTYLIHIPILAMIYGTYFRMSDSTTHEQWHLLVLAPPSWLVIAAISFFLFRHVEKRFIDIARNITAKKPHNNELKASL